MNKYIWFMMTAVMILALTACSDTEGTEQESAPEGEAAVVPYTTDDGEEIEIPEDPQRIVLLGTSYFGNLIQMDANVIGADSVVADSEVLEPYTEDIELVETGNIEQVMHLDPDLIISFNTDENLEKLKTVAPTVPVDYAKWNYLEIHKELGKITGNEEAAEQWVADWEAELAEDRGNVQEAVGEDATASVVEQYSKDIYVYGTNWGRGTEIIYQGLGLGVPEAVEEDVVETGWKNISAEEIDKYAGDYMFVGSGDAGADNAYRDTAVWNNLDAVENDRVTEFESPIFYYNDPYSLEYQKDIIVDALTK